LVDDEPLVRVNTAQMLAELGYDVVEAGSAREALDRLDGRAGFDLLVTDHFMPETTGTELARTVRRRSPDLPILIISGYADVADIAPDLPRLAKPFRQAELAQALAGLEV
jgi:CheY-like chemotaxis protein